MIDLRASINLAMGQLTATQLRAEIAAIVTAEMRQQLIDWITDKLAHAKVLGQGRTHFRITVAREFGSMWGNSRGECDRFADLAYELLHRAWIDQYPDMTPTFFMDKVHIPIPLSAKEEAEEIEAGWEIEIAGDERSMRENYEGSARTRKGKFLGVKHGKDALIEDEKR